MAALDAETGNSFGISLRSRRRQKSRVKTLIVQTKMGAQRGARLSAPTLDRERTFWHWRKLSPATDTSDAIFAVDIETGKQLVETVYSRRYVQSRMQWVVPIVQIKKA